MPLKTFLAPRPVHRALVHRAQQTQRMLLLAVCCVVAAGCVPGAGSRRPAGTAVDRLLAGMSVEEKVGQLMVVSFNGTTLAPEAAQMVRDYHVGGVILFQQNLAGPAQVRQLTRDLQGAAHVPLLIGLDQEGGPVVRLTQGVTLFPSEMGVGATFSPATAAAVAGATARELRELGFNVNFSPVVDVNSNPKNPVIGVRSYGGDPALVGALAVAAIGAAQREGVLAVAKHFPGHGDADVDSHLALPLIGHDLSRLQAVEFPPFQAAIGAGVDAVMTAHVLLQSVVALRQPAVVVALRLPYDLAELQAAPVLVAAYATRPATLRAVAELLFGAGPAPSGHLPVAVEPRWAFGFGLLDWARPDTLTQAARDG